MISRYIMTILFSIILMIAYYKYMKTILIYYAPKLAYHFRLTNYFPLDDIKGVIELAMIAGSHVIFCALLICLLPISWPDYSLNLTEIPLLIIYGILLGIGCMGLSGVVCKIAVHIIGLLNKKTDYDLKTWLTVGRGGWIKHHLQSMEILPFYFSLLILTMQVGSEEVIFRGVVLNYFMPFGVATSLLTSLILFIGMQAFLMNNWQSAIFPMIGATIMGLMHSILYLQVPVLWPLVIAHVVFFLFSVL